MQDIGKSVRSKRRIFTALLALALVALLVSFSGTYVTQASNQENTVVVTDGLGREVRITTPVRRIVISYPIATEMLFALGAEDRIVGIDMPSQKSEFLKSLKPDVATTVCVGGPRELNIEQAIALKPDLLLVGRNQEQVESLEARGIEGVFAVMAEDLDQLRASMENLGKALGEEEKAKQFIEYYNETLELVEERTSDLGEDKKPLVYIAGRDGLLSTCGKDMYQNSIINMAGGRNAGASQDVSAASRGWFKVSPEQLIKGDPDYILVVRYAAEVTPQKILDDPRFQGVSAVRNGRVFWFPSNLNSWDCPAPQAVLGVQWLAKLLHPDKFADLNLQEDVNAFFRTFYGKSFTELGGDM